MTSYAAVSLSTTTLLYGMSLFYKGISKSRGNFHVKSGYFQTALLQTSLILHTDTSLGMSWSSSYVQYSLCNHNINMWALLSDCIVVEQCAEIRFLRSVGIKLAEIHKRMLVQYGETGIMQRKLYRWVERFHCGKTSITEKDHCSATSLTVDNVERINTVVQEDRQIGVTDIANLQTMKGSGTCYIRGFACNQKHPLQVASGSSWTEVNLWRN